MELGFRGAMFEAWKMFWEESNSLMGHGKGGPRLLPWFEDHGGPNEAKAQLTIDLNPWVGPLHDVGPSTLAA